jgi:hypothetical protein
MVRWNAIRKASAPDSGALFPDRRPAAVGYDGRRTAPDRSQVSPVPSFTTVTVSPVVPATQRAAESAFTRLRYEPLPRAV